MIKVKLTKFQSWYVYLLYQIKILWIDCLILFQVSGFDREYWELEGLEFVSKLEEVTIELTTGSNGFELASYMLEHARKLKMMFVIITPDQSSLVPEIRMTNLTPHGRVVILERAASS